jgi:hypothetical protein
MVSLTDNKLLNFVQIIKIKLKNMEELTSKFWELEGQVILALINLHHRLIVVQD